MFPEPHEYWSQWPLPKESFERWPFGVESASDRNRLLDALEAWRDAGGSLDLDSDSMGFWMLDESERRAWMGAFFHHLHERGLDALFSRQMFGAFEMPPDFDPRHAVFVHDKAIYGAAERGLILRLMELSYATIYDEEWRYRTETLDYWSGRSLNAKRL